MQENKPSSKEPLSEPLPSGAHVQAITDIIARILEVQASQVTPAATIMGDLGADSLDVMEIIMAIEEQFDITISEEQADRVSTVGELCEAVARFSRAD